MQNATIIWNYGMTFLLQLHDYMEPNYANKTI